MKKNLVIGTFILGIILLGLSGCGSASSSGSSTPPTTPTNTSSNSTQKAPTGLEAASASSSTIRLTWEVHPSSNIEGYYVYRATTSARNFSRQTNRPVTSNTYVTTKPPISVTYYFYVTGINTSSKETPSSNVGTFTTPDTVAPATPSGLTLTRVNDDFVLEWDANTEADIAGYYLYRSTSSSGTFTELHDDAIEPDAPTFTDTSNQFAVRYYYKVKAFDTSGNFSSFSSVVSGELDGTAPVITVSQKPQSVTSQNRATFAFSANESVTWTCKLDLLTAVACTSPKTYTGLSEGTHTLILKASDTENNQTTKTISWSINAAAPVITFTSQPASLIATSATSFAYTLSDTGTVTAVLDNVSLGRVTSPVRLTGLSEGRHTFQLFVVDDASNSGHSEQIVFNVDTTAPTLTISSYPTGTSSQLTGSVTFSSSSSDIAKRTYKINGVDQGTAGSPLQLSNLPEGPIELELTLEDNAGNTTTRTLSWTVETYVKSIGQFGFDEGDLRLPEDIAVGSNGYHYVADGGSQHLVIYDANGTFSSIISIAVNTITETGAFPANAVFVNSSGLISLVDTGRSVINRYDNPFDSSATKWSPGITYPDEINQDNNGLIYLVSGAQHIVKIYSSGQVLRTVLGVQGQAGSDNSHFNNPQDVVTDSQNNSYVVDSNNHRIQVFNQQGTYLRTIGSGLQGSAHGSFQNPNGIAISDAGELYITDSSNHRVEVYSTTGTYRRSIGTGSEGSSSYEFNYPTGITYKNGKLYVVDRGNSRVQVFNR